MAKTMVSIYLNFDDVDLDDDTLKKEVYKYLTDLIEDDTLAYLAYYVEETNYEKQFYQRG